MGNTNKINKKQSVTRTQDTKNVKDVELRKKQTSKKVEGEILRKRQEVNQQAVVDRPNLPEPQKSHTGEEGTKQFLTAAKKAIKTMDKVCENPLILEKLALADDNYAVKRADEVIKKIEAAKGDEAKIMAANDGVNGILQDIDPEDPKSSLSALLALMLMLMKLQSQYWQIAQIMAESNIQQIVAGINKQMVEVENQAWTTLITGGIGATVSIAGSVVSAGSTLYGVCKASGIGSKSSTSDALTLKQQQIQNKQQNQSQQTPTKLETLTQKRDEALSKVTDLNNHDDPKTIEYNRIQTELDNQITMETPLKTDLEAKEIELDALKKVDDIETTYSKNGSDWQKKENGVTTKVTDPKEVKVLERAKEIQEAKTGINDQEYDFWDDKWYAKDDNTPLNPNNQNDAKLIKSLDTAQNLIDKRDQTILSAEKDVLQARSALDAVQQDEQKPLSYWDIIKNGALGNMTEAEIHSYQKNSTLFQLALQRQEMITNIIGPVFQLGQKLTEGTGEVVKSGQKKAELGGQLQAQEAGQKFGLDSALKQNFEEAKGSFKRTAEGLISDTSAATREAARRM